VRLLLGGRYQTRTSIVKLVFAYGSRRITSAILTTYLDREILTAASCSGNCHLLLMSVWDGEKREMFVSLLLQGKWVEMEAQHLTGSAEHHKGIGL